MFTHRQQLSAPTPSTSIRSVINDHFLLTKEHNARVFILLTKNKPREFQFFIEAVNSDGHTVAQHIYKCPLPSSSSFMSDVYSVGQWEQTKIHNPDDGKQKYLALKKVEHLISFPTASDKLAEFITALRDDSSLRSNFESISEETVKQSIINHGNKILDDSFGRTFIVQPSKLECSIL